MDYDKRLEIRLSEPDKRKLDAWSGKLGMNTSEVMRELLKQWFAHNVSVTKSDKDLR